MKHDQIGQLIAQVEAAAESYTPGSIEWREIWNAIKRTGASFKGAEFPSKKDRESAWQRYQVAVDQIKRLQEQEFEGKKRFRENSEKHLYQILHLVDLSLPDSGFGEMILTLATGGLNMLGKSAFEALFGKLDEELEALKQRSSYHRDAGAYFRENKHAMLGQHKHKAHEALGAARERLNADWESYKSRRHEAHEARKADWEDRQREFEQRREQWQRNQRDFLDRQRDALARLETALGNKKANRSRLDDMLSNARGDDFTSKVETWIDENEAAIDSIQDKISNVKDKIREVEDKLDE